MEFIYNKLVAKALEPESKEETIVYLESCLKRFLTSREQVLICFPNEPDNFGMLIGEAVRRRGGIPRFMDDDMRWITIMKRAFMLKCNAIVAPPLTVLGMAKLAKHMGMPLFARNVLVAGYPCPDWMAEGIERGLDCRMWGCYDPGSVIVGGFSCGKSRGIHLRSDTYGMRILGKEGHAVPDGRPGRIVLHSKTTPELCWDTGNVGCLERSACVCGDPSPRLMGIGYAPNSDDSLTEIGEELLHWSSILDCRLANTGHGLEIELVVFPGEKLPKIPGCAKLVVRNWCPEKDVPFSHMYVLKRRLFSEENS